MSASTLLEWLSTFKSSETLGHGTLSQLKDAIALTAAACEMYVNKIPYIYSPNRFHPCSPNVAETDLNRWLELIRFVQQQFLFSLKRDISHYPMSLEGLLMGSPDAIMEFMKLLFLAQVECENCEEFLPRILGLSDGTKAFVAEVVEELRLNPLVDYVEHSHDEYSKKCESLESIIKDHANMLEHSRTLQVSLEAELKLANDSLTSIQPELTRANDEVKLYKRELDSVRARAADLERECDSLKSRLKSTDVNAARVVSLEAELKIAKESLDKVKTSQTGDSALITKMEAGQREISALTSKLTALQELKDNEIIKLRGDIYLLGQEKEDLEREVGERKLELVCAKAEAEEKDKELGQFVMTGGALGGQIRDRIIRTLQEQLLVRDDEIETLKQQRIQLHEENIKGERLLISAVHAVGLRYHEEMVQRFQENDQGRINRQESPNDFYSQEYSNP